MHAIGLVGEEITKKKGRVESLDSSALPGFCGAAISMLLSSLLGTLPIYACFRNSS